MNDRDTKGDVYEHMLGKIATAAQNGQFRTPRHIIGLMVEMMAPAPSDVICDPAAGTCGFLVAAGEYVRHHHPEVLRDKKLSRHFHEEMFNGFDFDSTMLRIGSMNMLLHGVESPAERDRARTDQSFCVPKVDIVANGYDLSLNRYKELTLTTESRRAQIGSLLVRGP